MSVWTRVESVMKFPEPVTIEELEKVFGKQLDIQFISINNYYRKTEDGIVCDRESYKKDFEKAREHNKREWETYEGHEDEYLPTGSEGSLVYVKCRRSARKTEDGRYKYEISGSLRDYDDDEGIIHWFRKKFFELTNKHDDWTFKTYACVTASSGVGEIRWTDGQEFLKNES